MSNVVLQGSLGQEVWLTCPSYHPLTACAGETPNRVGPALAQLSVGQSLSVGTQPAYMVTRGFAQVTLPAHSAWSAGSIDLTLAVTSVDSAAGAPVLTVFPASTPDFGAQSSPRASFAAVMPAASAGPVSVHLTLPPAFLAALQTPGANDRPLWLVFATEHEANGQPPSASAVEQLTIANAVLTLAPAPTAVTPYEVVLATEALSLYGLFRTTASELVRATEALAVEPIESSPAHSVALATEALGITATLVLSESVNTEDQAAPGDPLDGLLEPPIALMIPPRTPIRLTVGGRA